MASWDEEKEPFIIAAIPLKDPFVTVEWAVCFNDIVLPPPYHVLFRRGPLPIDTARNVLVEEALKLNPKWILFWDSDVIVPQDAVYKLLAHQYPVVSALYVDKSLNRYAAFIERNGELRPVHPSVVGKVGYVDSVGFGFVLIEADVFRALKRRGIWPPFRYEYNPVTAPQSFSEDQYFCSLVGRELGIRVLLDARVVAQHVWTGKLVEIGKFQHLVP